MDCADLLEIILNETQADLSIPLNTLDHSASYNATQLHQDKEKLNLQMDFEDDLQEMNMEHERRLEKIENATYEVERHIFDVQNEMHLFLKNLNIYKNISVTCDAVTTSLSADGVFCKIPSKWFSDYQVALNEKIVLKQKLMEGLDCKAREIWLKSTGTSIKKALRLTSSQNEMLKLNITFEQDITQLKREHVDALHQTERENKQSFSNALHELQKLNLKHHTLLKELAAFKKNSREEFKGIAKKLILCPVYSSAAHLLAKYDDTFVMDVLNATTYDQEAFDPTDVLNFLKSSDFNFKFCVKFRGYNALIKLLKLNLHHADAFKEVKNLFSADTKLKLDKEDGECFDLIEFDDDVLMRHYGVIKSGVRCHHIHYCDQYEQFMMTNETIITTQPSVISTAVKEEVDWFDISENKNVKFLPINVFRKFPNLKIYYAFKSGIVGVYKNNFYGGKNLQGLWLDHNEIVAIESKSFDELSSLKWLYLGFNKLTTIDAQLLFKLKLLSSLSFESNRLTSLSPQVFNELADLEWLHLNGNPISSRINGTYFSNNKKLVGKYKKLQ